MIEELANRLWDRFWRNVDMWRLNRPHNRCAFHDSAYMRYHRKGWMCGWCGDARKGSDKTGG